jgi:hypothetical protein
MTGSLEGVRAVYLGSALALSGRYGEAADVLRGVSLTAIPDPWGREARWTLYVALVECGRGQAADSLLKSLAEEPGEIGRRARGMMRR